MKTSNNIKEKFMNRNKRDLFLTVIFTIISFAVYWLVVYLVGFNIFNDIKMVILFALVSMATGYGLMRKYKYGEEFKE